MKVKVLQEVINKRYYVYERSHPLLKCKITKCGFIDPDAYYFIDYENELIDRELISEFERYDMKYKVGDDIWYKNQAYRIKEVIEAGNEGIRLYLNKQRIIEKIGEREAEELLKEIKIKQTELIIKEKKLQLEQKLKETEDIYKSIKEHDSITYKIKKLFRRR